MTELEKVGPVDGALARSRRSDSGERCEEKNNGTENSKQ